MYLLESVFYMLWRGFAIGMIISAPMGPVGILCIQRTLDKGRKAGFYTGVGAAISDLFYCLLTGFGLSFIEEFLERNSAIIQLFGSVVLILFAVYLFRRNPASQLKKPSDSSASSHKNIIAGFFFTFSNPLILFLIIGLFARFNFLLPEIKFYSYIVGYIGILAGAIGWWWLVTFFIDKVRTHFNLRSMWLINKIIGGVILIFALVGIITAVTDLCDGDDASAKTLTIAMIENDDPPASIEVSDSIVLYKGECLSLNLDADTLPFSLRFCADFPNSRWGVAFPTDSVALCFESRDLDDAISSSKFLICSLYKGNNLLSSANIPFGTNLSHRENLFVVDRRGGSLSLKAGHSNLREAFSIDNLPFLADSVEFFCEDKGKLLLFGLSADVDRRRDEKRLFSPWRDADLLTEYLNNSLDPMEGIWQLLDYSLSDEFAKMGGQYRLALVRSTDGYDLIYLEGARVSPTEWLPGMVKAHLHPSGIAGVWNVAWIDSQGNAMEKDIFAQQTSTNVLTISFPYQNTTMRFQKTE